MKYSLRKLNLILTRTPGEKILLSSAYFSLLFVYLCLMYLFNFRQKNPGPGLESQE